MLEEREEGGKEGVEDLLAVEVEGVEVTETTKVMEAARASAADPLIVLIGLLSAPSGDTASLKISPMEILMLGNVAPVLIVPTGLQSAVNGDIVN